MRAARPAPLPPLAASLRPPPRVTRGNRSAAAPELCACVPPARPLRPVRAPRRRGCGTGAAPALPSEYRPPPPRPAPQTQTRRRRLGPRPVSRAPPPRRSRRAPRRSGAAGASPGGRRPLTSLGGPAGGAGAPSQPRPPPRPWAAGPRRPPRGPRRSREPPAAPRRPPRPQATARQHGGLEPGEPAAQRAEEPAVPAAGARGHAQGPARRDPAAAAALHRFNIRADPQKFRADRGWTQQRAAEALRGPGGAAAGEGAGTRGAAARAGAEERGHRRAGDHRAGAREAVPGGAEAQEPQAEPAVGGAGAARRHHRLPDLAAARHQAEAAQLQRHLGRQPRREPRAGRLQARAPQGQAARDAPPPHEEEPLRPPAPRVRRGLQVRGREPETPPAGTGGRHARPHPVPAGQGVGRGPPHQGEAPGHPAHRVRPRLRREAQGARGRGPPHPPRGPAAGAARGGDAGGGPGARGRGRQEELGDGQNCVRPPHPPLPHCDHRSGTSVTPFCLVSMHAELRPATSLPRPPPSPHHVPVSRRSSRSSRCAQRLPRCCMACFPPPVSQCGQRPQAACCSVSTLSASHPHGDPSPPTALPGALAAGVCVCHGN